MYVRIPRTIPFCVSKGKLVSTVNDTADQLVRRCVAATSEAADFPTLWDTVLRRHSLVVGPRIQRIEGGRAWLRIPLVTKSVACF
jgi:hypothetical protein